MIDPDAVVIARLMDERLAGQEVIKAQREQIRALITALRCTQRALCSVTSLAEMLLSSDR